jgi:hypothetical protein
MLNHNYKKGLLTVCLFVTVFVFSQKEYRYSIGKG